MITSLHSLIITTLFRLPKKVVLPSYVKSFWSRTDGAVQRVSYTGGVLLKGLKDYSEKRRRNCKFYKEFYTVVVTGSLTSGLNWSVSFISSTYLGLSGFREVPTESRVTGETPPVYGSVVDGSPIRRDQECQHGPCSKNRSHTVTSGRQNYRCQGKRESTRERGWIQAFVVYFRNNHEHEQTKRRRTDYDRVGSQTEVVSVSNPHNQFP